MGLLAALALAPLLLGAAGRAPAPPGGALGRGARLRAAGDDGLVPAPDHYDCDNGSASATYEGPWEIVKGGSGVFFFSHNESGFAGNTLVGISDYTIPYSNEATLDAAAKKPMVPANASSLVRNISVSLALYDGVYSTDGYMLLAGTGFYYPSVRRGVAYLVYPYGFSRPRVTLNMTYLEPYLLNTDDTWPPTKADDAADFTDFTPDAEANLEAGRVDIRECVFMLYFNSTREPREISSHTYPPDSQLTLLGEAVPYNATHEEVPVLKLRLIGNTSMVDFTMTSPIINRGPETKQALYYSATMAAACMVLLVVGVHTFSNNLTPLKLEFISMTSVVLQTLYDMMVALQCINTTFSGGLGSNCLLLVALIYAAFCLMVDFQFLIQKYTQHRLRTRGALTGPRMLCMYVLFYVGIFAVLLVQQYVPYKAIFFVELALFSFWLAQGIFTLATRKQRYGFTYLFVVVSTVVRLCPLIYFYAYPGNFLKQEAEAWYAYAALGWGGGQMLFLVLVMLIARRVFNASAKGREDFYCYAGRPLSTVVLDELEEGSLYALPSRGAASPAAPYAAPYAAGAGAGAGAGGGTGPGGPGGAPADGPGSGFTPLLPESAEHQEAPAAWQEALLRAAEAGYNVLLPYKHYTGLAPGRGGGSGAQAGQGAHGGHGGHGAHGAHAGHAGHPGRGQRDPYDFSDNSEELGSADAEAAGARGAGVAVAASAGAAPGAAQGPAPRPAPQATCLNPLHPHSPLYAPGLRPAAFFRALAALPLAPARQAPPGGARDPFSSVAPQQTLCFTLTPARGLRELVSCTICLDTIALRAENLALVPPACPAARAHELAGLRRGWEALGREAGGAGEPQLWMTPCGHCFHDACLSRWAEENLQCPVDREPIPVPTEAPV